MGPPSRVLPAQTKPGNQLSVALDVIVPDVIEEPATAADQLHEPAPGVMIPFVHSKVLSEVRDALREDGNLDLGGPGVGVMLPIGNNRGGFVGHTASYLGWTGIARRRTPGRPCIVAVA